MTRYDSGSNNGYDRPENSSSFSQINMRDEGTNLGDLPPDKGERFDQARRSAFKVYLVLIAAGLVIGGISLVGIVLLMQHFGLTDVPVQVDN